MPPEEVFHSVALRSETIQIEISGVRTDCLILYDSCSDTSILAMGDDTRRQVGAAGCPGVYTDIGLTTANAVREAPRKKYACSNGILPDSVSTPPTSSKRTLCGRYFSPKMGKFFETAILTLGMVILKITVVKHDS